MKFAPGGHSTFFAMLNSFVHIVMYFYYMLAAMGPQIQKYLWWKKYLTAFQMVSYPLLPSYYFNDVPGVYTFFPPDFCVKIPRI